MKVVGSTYGDWDKLSRILQNLSNNRPEYHSVVEDTGYKIADTIYELIKTQAIDLEPLVAEYRKRKISEGYGDSILVRTEDFINSITVTDIQVKGQDMEVFISVIDGVTETGISMKELAEYLEYGTSKMTGREPFQKSWDEMKDDVKREVEEKLKDIIVEDLRA